MWFVCIQPRTIVSLRKEQRIAQMQCYTCSKQIVLATSCTFLLQLWCLLSGAIANPTALTTKQTREHQVPPHMARWGQNINPNQKMSPKLATPLRSRLGVQLKFRAGWEQMTFRLPTSVCRKWMAPTSWRSTAVCAWRQNIAPHHWRQSSDWVFWTWSTFVDALKELLE